MAVSLSAIYNNKETYSTQRLRELADRVAQIDAAAQIPGLTIFVAGSYARLEASEYSDIDLFFVCAGNRDGEKAPRTNELEMFGHLIVLGKEMGFPKFSGDARYLQVHSAEDVKRYLGGREDDFRNLFTLRLLMMLESTPIFGSHAYEEILNEFIVSYYRDYPKHQATFEPTFLVNDIARYWRTLLANYEHARKKGDDLADRIPQKVRNYKLKYSRLTTCFATIAALASHQAPVEPADVRAVVSKTPRQRLEYVAERIPEATQPVQDILDGYAVFLQQTELPASELETKFNDKASVEARFSEAIEYGDTFFKLLSVLDEVQQAVSRKVLRTLVI